MPAKLSINVANEIIDTISKENDVEFISSYVDNKTPIKFLCKNCGNETKITWGQLQQGKNPNFVCLSCSYEMRSKTKSKSYKELYEEIENNGSLLLNSGEEKINTHTELKLICTYCGDEFSLRYGDYKRGRNKKLRCPKCAHIVNGNYLYREANRISRSDRKEYNYSEIENTIKSIGATLLTSFEEYVDFNSYIRFGCSKCGKEHKIRWAKFLEGQNPNLLCTDCLPEKNVYTTEIVRKEFEEHGVELLNEYKNIQAPLLFKCSQCGKITSISWGDYLYLGRNKLFLCDTCRKGNYSSDPYVFVGTSSEGAIKRTKAESRSREFCKMFYNLDRNIMSNYESHHIKPLKLFPALKFSLGNLYPLLKEEHHTNNFQYYHCLEESRNPENWSDAAKLPYHNYSGFKFFDLNKFIVTDFILDETNNLFNIKKEFAEKGILYIPFYFNELDIFKKAQISYSLIRNRLAKISGIGIDIYRYTNQEFMRYNTRKLKIKTVNFEEAYEFFDNNHIQGYVQSSICLGLYQDDLLVSAMSFGSARSNLWKGENNYELLRFCSKINSSVPGAASKLFKYFVKNYNPELVVTFCDVRFSSIDPNETVYPKLGFMYDGYSKPNYKYYKDGVFYVRQQFMKHKLKDKLEIFDSNLSETENMHRNGYKKLYDCGNFRFIWKKGIENETL